MGDPSKDLMDGFGRAATLATAPFDAALRKEAQDARGHLGSKAVSEEYNRLILQKYHRPQPRGFFARLFGR
jgi:hypothetical protein